MTRRVLLSVILLFAPAFAQPPKQSPPPPGPARPFHFPKYETKKLANGLTVFVIEDHREPLVSYVLELSSAGSSANEPWKAGLAATTAQLLRQGTKTRTAQQIAKEIDLSGGSLNSSAGYDSASAECTMMKSQAGLGIELLADIILNPTFPQAEFDRMMRQTLSGLQVEYGDPASLSGLLTRRIAFGNHIYGIPVEGTPETVAKLKRDDIVKFYDAHYGPEFAYLAISGDVTPEEAMSKAEKYFGTWNHPASSAGIMMLQKSTGRRIVTIDKPDAVQTQYSIAQVSIARNDPDFIPLQVANQIFGGSFNSRLGLKLRAEEGLTYGANSALESQKQAGLFAARSFSRTEKTVTAIKMMSDLLADYREHPVTESELSDAKAYLAGSFGLSIETPAAVAQRVLFAAIIGLPPNYWDTYRDRILATTADEVSAAVQRHITPDNMDIVAVGNVTQISKDLAALGKVEVIPLAEFDLTARTLRKEAAPPATAEAKAKGMKLAEQAVDAIGGKAAIDGVKDMESKGPTTIAMGKQSMKADIEEALLFPDKYRASVALSMGSMVQGHDGKDNWMQQGQRVSDGPPAMARDAIRSIDLAGAVGLLRSALDGKATIVATGDNSAIWTKGDDKIAIVFDPASKRIAKLSYHSEGGPGGPADIDVEYADYRQVDGVYLPFKETMYRDGQKMADREYTERKINTGVKPEIFARPAG
jgi:predicted Zn-dependent peptidase